jgi:alpha-2-macroglobulin
VVLTIEVKNDYDYLLLEDLKPAGFEAVDLLSGGDVYARELRADAISQRATDPRAALTVNNDDYTARTAWIHRELRDRQVALFVSHLPQGVWEVRYQLRAEAPGTFHALPVLAHAMYVPEIRGNSAEVRVMIDDRKD